MPQTVNTDDQDRLSELLARCALRDQQAFLLLYDATSVKLYSVILRILKKDHWADEAMQDVYLKIWNSADSYSNVRGRPMTWMINIARNRAIDFLRGAEQSQAQRTQALDDDTLATLVTSDNSEQDSLMGRRLQHCLSKLEAAHRDCLLMLYHSRYSPREVALHQGHPEGTVKSWTRRALASLRGCMGL